ncbi:hypothetical protein FO519_004454 [Halicephalobus sp. NKZ332]|nr:hypothetical protein FO519_004454 [Halicephalobus sp. NKZ332]
MSAVNPEDLKLPQAPIVKLMKTGAGEGIQFSNEAKVAVARAAAVFCLHVVDSAATRSSASGRKTVNVGDIVAALDDMEVPEFKEKINDTVEEYRAAKGQKKKK